MTKALATPTSSSSTEESLLRLPAVESRTGLSKTAIYSGMRNETFPKALKVQGTRVVAWQRTVIDAWIADQIKAAVRTR